MEGLYQEVLAITLRTLWISGTAITLHPPRNFDRTVNTYNANTSIDDYFELSKTKR